jgi:hypothetical protein
MSERGGTRDLASLPVIVLTDRALSPIAEAGARRAGRGPRIIHVAVGADIDVALSDAGAARAEVVIVDVGGPAVLRVAARRAALALAALPLERPGAIAALLTDLDVDVHVPLPVPDDEVRTRVRAIVDPFRLEDTHHLVDVDPRPAFAELGEDVGTAGLDRLAAGAAGVLAGRLAVGNRRWRDRLTE